MNQESSDKRAEANRLNAQKSTGPRTPEGKQAVRLNALKHGLSARTIVLPGESGAKLKELCDDLEAQWQPQDHTEQYLLEKMAIAQWQQARGYRREAQILGKPERYSTEKENEWTMLRDIRQRLERTWSKSLAELRAPRKDRRLEQELAAKLECDAAKPEKQTQPDQPQDQPPAGPTEPSPLESAKQSQPEPPAAYMPETPQAEPEKQSQSKRPFIPNPDHYFNTRDILRQVKLEKARKQAEEQSPPPLDRP